MIRIGTAERVLADLKRITDLEADRTRQISSGRRVERPSDGPQDVVDIISLRAQIDRSAQITANLEATGSEVKLADAAVGDAIRTIEAARALAMQATGGLRTAAERAIIAEQVRGLQEHLIALSRTTFEGRYVFGGDAEQLAPYELDPSSPAGVRSLTDGSATTTIQDAAGIEIRYRQSAQAIFDDPAASAFAAIEDLSDALEANSEAGIEGALDALRRASDHLDLELGFYGAAQRRLHDASEASRAFVVHATSELSVLADADVPEAITELEQARVQREAALAIQARRPQTLFDLLG